MNNRIGYDIIQREDEIVDMLAQKERQDQSLCACLTSTNANLERRAQATLLETARQREFKSLTKAISETYMYMKMMESDKKKICIGRIMSGTNAGNQDESLVKTKGTCPRHTKRSRCEVARSACTFSRSVCKTVSSAGTPTEPFQSDGRLELPGI